MAVPVDRVMSPTVMVTFSPGVSVTFTAPPMRSTDAVGDSSDPEFSCKFSPRMFGPR